MTTTSTEHLLANRELLSLDRARLYLGSRQRVRSPLGAVEYLQMAQQPNGLWWQPASDDLVFERNDKPLSNDSTTAYDKRLKVALDCMNIYRNAFPREYAASASAPLSLRREQELYYLIHTQLFPLWLTKDGRPVTDAEMQASIESRPSSFMPYVRLRGLQSHIWEEGRFNFREVEIEYQVALALAWQWQMPAGRGWEMLKLGQSLADCPAPLQSAAGVAGGTVAWSLFCHSCRVEGSPLRWLPLAFHATAYKTGNHWLDLPQGAAMGLEWSLRQVFQLHMMYAQAEDMKLALKALGVWFEENPRERITHCVEIWNDAVRKEQQSGFAGELRDDETGDWLQ